MTRERLRALFPFAVLAAAAAALTAWLLLTSRIPRGADQAVVALMARHILEGRGHPAFYWGSTYGGTLEPHLLIPVFALFGPTPEAFRGLYVLLWAAFGAGTVAFTARFFGRPAALVAAAFLAVPPFFLPYKLLTSDGAYASVACLGLAVLWLALEADERLEAGRPRARLLAALGLAAGLGAWVTPVTLAVPAAALLWLLLRPGRRPSAAEVGALATGALLGASPSLVWNARHGFASLHARELAPAAGAGLLANAASFFSESLPVLLGALRPNFSADAPPSFPGAAVLVPLLAAALAAPAVLAARRDRRLRLLAGVLALLAAGTIAVARLAPREPRYMVAAYAAFVPLLSAGLAGLRPGRLRAAAGAGFALLLASDLAGAVRARRHLADADDSQVTAPLRPLLDALRRIGATHVWANYWTAYRVTFESGGAILATPVLREEGTRNLEWDAAVRAAEDPAVVLLPPRDACFRAALAETGEPFREERAGAFAIFGNLPAGVRRTVAEGGALPMPAGAYRPVWSDPNLPARLNPREAVTASIRVANAGPCTWMVNVRLLASWSGPSRAEQAFAVPDRRVAPGAGADLAFTLRPPETPGRYLLRLDLEQEGLTRFSSRGGAAFEAEVEVAR